MAFCGVKFTTEQKEVVIDEDSLKNICAFSSKLGQMAKPSSEGLIEQNEHGKKEDRRIKVDYRCRDFHYDSYLTLCQITAKLPSGMKGVGSCTGIDINDTDHVLTCAHNLVGFSPMRGCMVKYRNLRMYQARQGEKKWWDCTSLEEDHIRYHPKYNGDPDSGFDIGVCKQGKSLRVGNWSPPSSQVDVEWGHMDPQKIKKGMPVEIAGYPAEKEGHPYYHTGTIVAVKKTALGGYILFYNVDTTPGNSGSCIMLTDENVIKQSSYKPHVKKLTIGVHTGHSHEDGLNYGTLLTPSLFKWICNG